MAKSTADRQREYRERQRQNQQKAVSFLLDADIIETVTSNAKQQGTTQADYLNELLRQAVTSNDSELRNRITELEAQLKRQTVVTSNENLGFKERHALENLKLENDRLNRQLSTFKQCQCLTATGDRCKKTATHENPVNFAARGKNGFCYDVLISTCESHFKKYINN